MGSSSSRVGYVLWWMESKVVPFLVIQYYHHRVVEGSKNNDDDSFGENAEVPTSSESSRKIPIPEHSEKIRSFPSFSNVKMHSQSKAKVGSTEGTPCQSLSHLSIVCIEHLTLSKLLPFSKNTLFVGPEPKTAFAGHWLMRSFCFVDADQLNGFVLWFCWSVLVQLWDCNDLHPSWCHFICLGHCPAIVTRANIVNLCGCCCLQLLGKLWHTI